MLVTLAGLRRLLVAGAVTLGLVFLARDSPMAAPLDRGRAVANILSALEITLEGRRLPERAREKLLALEDGQFRVIASLAERAGSAPDTAGAKLALLLITALIILL